MEGEVLATVRKKYAASFRIAARTVLTNQGIRSALEDIATCATAADKAWLLKRHEVWMETLDEAVDAVEKSFKNTEKAKKLLELKADIEEFTNGINMRAARRLKVAKSARRMAENLIEDLDNFMKED